MAAEGIRSVLAATDLGPASEPVVAAAAALARRLDAELHLVHALEIERLPDLEHPSFPARIRQAEELLAEQGRRAAAPVPPASAVVVNHAAHQAVEDRAREVAAGIIVVGPHRGGDVGAHFLGTSADRVIRTAQVPVLVVRRALALPVARMGVPTDFSEPSHGAMDLALRLAEPLAGGGGGGEIVVFHAAWVVEQDEAAARATLESSLEKAVKTALERAGGVAGVPVRTALAWGVSPVKTIARYAEEHQLDLLVMGTHGHGGLRRMIAGSVASGVARQATCSVLLAAPRSRAVGGEDGRERA